MKTWEQILFCLVILFVSVILISSSMMAQTTNSTIEFPSINAVNPIVQPATGVITYDKYWLQRFNVYASSPSQKVRFNAVLVPYDGGNNIITDPTKSVNINNSDLMTLVANNPAVANAITALEAALETVCKANNTCK